MAEISDKAKTWEDGCQIDWFLTDLAKIVHFFGRFGKVTSDPVLYSFNVPNAHF